MEKQIITFTANEQTLKRAGGECHYSSNKVSYIEAHFALGDNWSGYDSVRAVWFTDYIKGISTVLDSNGVCIVPTEVLKRKAKVNVNLVGSISVDNVLTDRLTSYPIVAVVVDADARVESTETAEITPSQFEQYVAMVHDEVETVTGMTAEAETLPAGSEATASYSDGVLSFGIPKGDKGDTGDTGNGIESVELNDDYTLTIEFTDGTSVTTDSIRGEKGNGIVSIAKTGTSGLIDTYTITYDDGDTETFTVTNGAKGDKGDTGNGIASVALTSTVGYVKTYTITFTDGTTTTFDVTDGEISEEALDEKIAKILPEDSASGAIASFPDGTDLLPAKSLLVALDPIQDLHGYDKPWSGGGGANKLPPIESKTSNGITLTNNDGQYTLNGTATANAFFTIEFDNPLAVGSYYWSLFNPVAQSGVITYLLLSSGNVSLTTGSANAEQAISPSSEITTFRIRVDSGTTLTNYKLSPMLITGSTAPTQWTPYANECPIYGWDSVKTVNMSDITNRQYFQGLLDGTYGVVDLGSLNWTFAVGDAFVFQCSPPNIVIPTEYLDRKTGCLTSDYPPSTVISVSAQMDDKSWLRAYGAFYIRDTAYASPSEFKQAMSGVHLIYELATPTTPTITKSEFDSLLEEFGIGGQMYTTTLVENIWDEEWEVGTLNVANGNDQSVSTRIRSKNYIPILPNTTYCLKQGTIIDQSTGRVCYYDADKNFIEGNATFPSGSNSFKNPMAFTTPTNAYYMRFSPTTEYGTTYNNDIRIYYAPMPDGAVYGCKIDVATGELTVDRAMVDLGTLNWRYDSGGYFQAVFNDDAKHYTSSETANAICSNYAVASVLEATTNNGYFGIYYYTSGAKNYIRVHDDAYTDATAFKTAMSGVQLVYELAQPQTYQLTPQQIDLLTGNNNVWSDGDVTVTYKADIQLWVEKQLG